MDIEVKRGISGFEFTSSTAASIAIFATLLTIELMDSIHPIFTEAGLDKFSASTPNARYPLERSNNSSIQ
ncbi:hypothetical protein Leryth_006375 [Lithospermum erythrorhizon]|nr:hypothetical protein Leryth_006375 [Lithospermum erythrorhizon]